MRAHTEPKFLCNCLLNKNNNKVFLVHELLQYEQRGLVPSWFMGHQACFSWLCQNVAVLSPCHQAVNDSSRLCKVKSTVIRRAGYPAVWQHAGCLSCKINNPQDLRISVDLWAFFLRHFCVLWVGTHSALMIIESSLQISWWLRGSLDFPKAQGSFSSHLSLSACEVEYLNLITERKTSPVGMD